jgi:hypothetical protein
VSFVSLPGGEDYLFEPVNEGYCRLESLYDGTLDLAKIALANDAIAVKRENQRRYEDWLKRQEKR